MPNAQNAHAQKPCAKSLHYHVVMPGKCNPTGIQKEQARLAGKRNTVGTVFTMPDSASLSLQNQVQLSWEVINKKFPVTN